MKKQTDRKTKAALHQSHRNKQTESNKRKKTQQIHFGR